MPTKASTAANSTVMWLTLAISSPVDTFTTMLDWFREDDGLDEAPSKMIYLAVGVALAIAAGVFIIAQFNSAKDSVPDPVAPAP